MIHQNWQKRNENLSDMIRTYKNIQEANVSGKVADQLYEETKASNPEQEKILDENEG